MQRVEKSRRKKRRNGWSNQKYPRVPDTLLSNHSVSFASATNSLLANLKPIVLLALYCSYIFIAPQKLSYEASPWKYQFIFSRLYRKSNFLFNLKRKMFFLFFVFFFCIFFGLFLLAWIQTYIVVVLRFGCCYCSVTVCCSYSVVPWQTVYLKWNVSRLHVCRAWCQDFELKGLASIANGS